MTIQVRSNEKPAIETTATKVEGEGAQATVDAKTTAPDGETTETKEATTSEPVETEEQETETTETDEAGKVKPPKKGGFQRRIDKLNTRISAKEQELEYWKQQALKGASETKTETRVETTPTSDGKPTPDSFETHTEYVEALTDWKTDQKLNARDQKLEQTKIQTEQAKLATSYSERAKAFASKTPDFDEVISDANGITASPAMYEILLSSENGPELAYELAKNPEEFARISKLPPLAAAREMGKLESKLAPASSAETNGNRITKAPKPLTAVGTGGKGSVPKSIADPNLSQSEYERLRRAEIKARRQAA